MPLALGVSEKSKFYLNDTEVLVDKLNGHTSATLVVAGERYIISPSTTKEIFPQVFASMGKPLQEQSTPRILIDAPRSIRVLREALMREYLLPTKMLFKASKLKVSADKVVRMLGRSTPVEHPQGNRRCYEYVFMVSPDGEVSDINFVPEWANETETYRDGRNRPPRPIKTVDNVIPSCDTCHDTKRVQVYDQCDACEGVGCEKCKNGTVPKTIPCPMCSQKGVRGDNRKEGRNT